MKPWSKRSHSLLGAIGLLAVVSPGLLGQADEGEIIGPTLLPPPPPPATAPAVQPPAPATAPTAAATTQPSPETVLQNLLHAAPAAVAVPAKSGSVIVAPPEGAAPHPKVALLREGDNIAGRIGRLIKDEKTGQWMFAFEADGKEMRDPPMGVVPSRYLEVMEKLSEDGKQSIKFKVSGEVTEYRGKNYLYVHFVQVERELNKF